MSLQNRVDPWGKLLRDPARGALLGNRGILHNNTKEIISTWRHRHWVTCLLTTTGKKRDIFSPGNYSELFFLDEATAFSAGHRPCRSCQRQRYDAFKAAWCAANATLIPEGYVPIDLIDRVLHAERTSREVAKITFTAPFSTLPNGTFIEVDGHAHLIWHGSLFVWSPQGYQASRQSLRPDSIVTVLTPASIVQTFRAGFLTCVDPSAK